MVGKKQLTSLSTRLGLISFLLISTLFLSACSSGNSNQDSKDTVSIGISQLVEHVALDSAREGFIAALKEKGYEEGKNLKIDLQIAQGDIALTTTIAQNLASQKKDLILAIATPAAQSAGNVIKDTPILFTAVTDSVVAGLLENPEAPEANITGTVDIAPIDKQFNLGKTLFPDAKTIGIIYNTSEINSQIQVNLAKEEASKLGLKVIEITATTTSELEPAINAKIKNIDLIFLPSDNLVASSMPIIAKLADDNQVPIIGAEEAHVQAGALACDGIDYYRLGHQTGIMAVEIIEGKDVKDIPVSMLKDTQLVINETVAKKLGITIPKEIFEKAKLTKGDE